MMFTKKKINIVLGTLVIIIYAALLYKFFRPQQEIVIQNKGVINSEDQKVLLKSGDSFKLMLNNKDPFLGDRSRFLQTVITKSIPPSEKPRQRREFTNQQPISWPVIRYFGYISSVGDHKVAVLRIRDQMYRLKEGSTFQGVLLTQILVDSIKLELNNKIKYVKKEKILVNKNN